MQTFYAITIQNTSKFVEECYKNELKSDANISVPLPIYRII